MHPGLHHSAASLAEEGAARTREPCLLIDAGASRILAANRAGWAAWGLEPDRAAPPLSIDRAMPALVCLRSLADKAPAVGDMTLVFWTAAGLLRLRAHVHPAAEPGRPATFLVRAIGPAAANGSAAVGGGKEAAGLARPLAPARDLARARLAHELRTPLSALIAYAEVLKDEHLGALANARYRGYAEAIHECARHALAVVDGMLLGEGATDSPARHPAAEADPIRVVESCLRVARPLADRAGLTIEARLPSALPPVRADELALKQMLLNLLANAIKYTRIGDRVVVGVAHDGEGGISITVTDSGPGIAGASARAAGAPKPRGAGMGLGLPLTRELAEANGAALIIASAPGQGTRASIAFPASRVVRREELADLQT
jgi:signal transduction histidine kinase